MARLPGQQEGAGHVQPGQGLDSGPAGRDRAALRPVPEVGADPVEDRQAGRLAHARRRGAERVERRHRHGARPLPAAEGREALPVLAGLGGEEVRPLAIA